MQAFRGSIEIKSRKILDQKEVLAKGAYEFIKFWVATTLPPL